MLPSDRFKVRLRIAIDATGLNQKEFGERLGREKSIVGKWLKGTTEPNLDTLAQIARASNRSVDWLLGLDATAVEPPGLEAAYARTVEERGAVAAAEMAARLVLASAGRAGKKPPRR